MRASLLSLLLITLVACQSSPRVRRPSKSREEPIRAPKRPREPTPKTRDLPKEPKQLERVLSIEAHDEALASIVDRIRQRTKAKVRVDPAIKAKITVTLRELPWSAILQVLAKLAKVELQERHGSYVFRAPPQTSVHFVDTDLKTALMALAAQSGRNIIIAPGVEGKVNCRLNKVDPARALKVIAETSGYTVVDPEGRR